MINDEKFSIDDIRCIWHFKIKCENSSYYKIRELTKEECLKEERKLYNGWRIARLIER